MLLRTLGLVYGALPQGPGKAQLVHEVLPLNLFSFRCDLVLVLVEVLHLHLCSPVLQ